MRLDRYLAEMNAGTRSELKKRIRKGEVTVNGVCVRDADHQVEEEDIVTLGGEEIAYHRYEYYLLHKPAGYVCTLDRSLQVTELIPEARKDVMPVGRLDKDTEGLLLLTNDGQLAHKLISPKNHVEKLSYAETDLPIPEAAIEAFAEGLELEDFKAMPAKLQIPEERKAFLTICEGKYHQVRRMFAKMGCEVLYLRRERFDFLDLSGVPCGEHRLLNEEEVALLKKHCEKTTD